MKGEGLKAFAEKVDIAAGDAAAMLLSDPKGAESLLSVLTETRNLINDQYQKVAEAQIINGNTDGRAATYLGKRMAFDHTIELIQDLTKGK